MMHDREKSDPATVACGSRASTNPGDRQRRWCSQGRGPRGTRARQSTHRDAGDGGACHKRWNAVRASRKAKEEGEVHGVLPPAGSAHRLTRGLAFFAAFKRDAGPRR